MHESHAELEKTPDKGHLLRCDFSRAEKGIGLGVMFGLNVFEPLAKQDQDTFPIAGLEGRVAAGPDERCRPAVWRSQWCKSFPAFWASFGSQ
jgi:hypothetical protein